VNAKNGCPVVDNKQTVIMDLTDEIVDAATRVFVAGEDEQPWAFDRLTDASKTLFRRISRAALQAALEAGHKVPNATEIEQKANSEADRPELRATLSHLQAVNWRDGFVDGAEWMLRELKMR
jgi:hypothetical protein